MLRMTATGRPPLSHYWTPGYWPTWLGIGVLRLTCFLPYKLQIRLGKFLGRIAHRIAGKRRAITRRNIEICFPEMSAPERNDVALRHFEALGTSLMEIALARWASAEKIARLVTVSGKENVWEAGKGGKGVILISAHFTTQEITGYAACADLPPVDLVYRKFRSGLTTEFVASTREMFLRKTINKDDIKTMVRSLREGAVVWYAPDQSYNLNHSAMMDFFGEPSMTNIATSTLAKLGRAKVVPYFPRRLPEGGYEGVMLPALEGVPSNDPIADTRKYLDVLEEYIRKCPEQYYWIHRKFKNRPAELPDAYANLDALK